MANEGGNNQFQGFGTEAPWGDQKKNFELLRQAPLSGAPTSGRALGAPERQRSARRRAAAGSPNRSGGGPQRPTTTILPQLPIPYEQQIALIWRQVAAIPGASELVQHLADSASQAAQSVANGPPQDNGSQQ